MTELDTLIRREMERAGSPQGSFEDLRRQRDRRRRNERLAAGALGIAITLGIVLVGIRLFRIEAPRPAHRTPSVSAPVPSAVVGSFRSGFAPIVYRGLSGMWHLKVDPGGTFHVAGTLDGSPVAWSGRMSVPGDAVGAELTVQMAAGGACADLPPGRYSWGRTDAGLSFFVIKDPCRARARAIALAGHIWGPV